MNTLSNTQLSLPRSPKIFTSLSDLGPGYKLKDFPIKAYHNGDEIGIGNISSIDTFVGMKQSGMNFPLSCVILRTKELAIILLQEIEFKPH